MNTLYAALAFLAFVLLLVVLAAKDTDVTVSQKLNDLSASIANVTSLVKSQSAQLADQSAQIAALKAQIDANQAVQAQADADVASLQAQIDALNALTVPVAPPAPPAQ